MRTPSRTALALILAAFPALAPAQAPKTAAPAGRPTAPAPAGAPKAAPAPADPAARKTLQQMEPEDPKAAQKMDALLKAWEAKSASIKTLKVDYKRTDVSALFKTKKVYTGKARFTSDNKAFLDFYETTEAGKPGPLDERIICDGRNVYQFKGATRQIFVFALPADGRQKALQQGPLPFLFNMKAAEARKRYAMTLLDDKGASYIIRVIPLLDIDREEYSQALLMLDKAKLRPEAIQLWSPNGKDTKTFKFDPDITAENDVINPDFFDAQAMVAQLTRDPKSPWKVVENPEPDAPAGAAASARPAAPAAAPAAAGMRAPVAGQGAMKGAAGRAKK